MVYLKKIFTVKSYKDLLKYVLFYVLEVLEKREGRFYTLHWRPALAESVSALPLSRTGEDTVSIVMQGPLCLKDDFTYNTCLLYKKLFPSSQLILSTWVNEDVATLNKIKDSGWTIIVSEQPDNRGYANINLQIKSTLAGITEAKEKLNHTEYVLKTRTDQRMYNENALQFFLGLSKTFPSVDTEKQKGRLIVPIDTPLLRVYGVGDMVMFGHIDDMMSYWNVPLDVRQAGDLAGKVSSQNSVESFSRLELSEVYLTANYLRKLGHELTWNLVDSWKVIGTYFVIAEPSQIDLFWQKNSLRQEFKHCYYTMNHTWGMMTFADWLLLYQGNYSTNSVPAMNTVYEGASLEQPDTIYVQGKLS